MKVLLRGVVGSTAYGLAREGSDIDRLGVFAAPTAEVLGLGAPKESVVTKDPDITLHEAKKFAVLCLNGNPSVSEVLWLADYEVMTGEGAALVEIRRAFLSAPRVRDAYLGYAVSQFTRLARRGDGSFSADTRRRTEKHARHLVRLVEQGLHLYTTGDLVVDLRDGAIGTDPQKVFAMGRAITENPDVAEEYLEQARARFDETASVLPEQPDREAVERWLLDVRRRNPISGWPR